MPIHVFIVEDQPRQLAAMRAKVEGQGYAVAGTGSNKAEVLAYFESDTADVVLMDINLNNRNDGIELASVIRERYGVPVIYVTAMASNDIIQSAIKTGPSGYLLKPVDPAELKANIELAVQQQAPMPAAPNPQSDYITVRLGQKLVKTHFRDISHLKIEDKNYVTVVDKHQKELAVRGSLSQLLSTVFPANFLRTHYSYGINLEYVDTIDEPTQSIQLLTGEAIPIGKAFKKDVYRRMNIT